MSTSELHESERQDFERKYWFEIESPLSDLEAEVARLYDTGLDTPEKILEALCAAWQKEGKGTSEEILDAPLSPVNIEDIRIILRNYEEYRQRFPHRTGSGRPRKLSWQGYSFLMRLLYRHPQPSVCGYKEEEWTKRLLIDCLARWGEKVSERTLTRILHDADYFWNGQIWVQPPQKAQTPPADAWIFHDRRDACGCFNEAIFQEDLKRVNAVPPDPELAITLDGR